MACAFPGAALVGGGAAVEAEAMGARWLLGATCVCGSGVGFVVVAAVAAVVVVVAGLVVVGLAAVVPVPAAGLVGALRLPMWTERSWRRM